MSSSIGIAVYPDDSDDPEELLKHADVAMYRSKELGRNTYQFLDANLAEHRLRQHTLETALRTALADEALRLHYQPVVRINDRAIIGAEALLRWSDPEHGNVPPQVFIPLAEESGLIHALCEWVLKSAARQCVEWRRAGLQLTVSVNMSARQFYREDLAQRISEIVKAEECEPSWIELEVTETSLLHDIDAIRKVLHQLRDEGFTVAIDDFGTGYSSLTHLKHFPIDTLKIDISFIADLESDPQDAAITEAIIGLARGLGLRVVAEGVGTRAQLEFLELRGCDCFQGFWVSKPLPADDFYDFVRSVTGDKERATPRDLVSSSVFTLSRTHSTAAANPPKLPPPPSTARASSCAPCPAGSPLRLVMLAGPRIVRRRNLVAPPHDEHRRRRGGAQQP